MYRRNLKVSAIYRKNMPVDSLSHAPLISSPTHSRTRTAEEEASFPRFVALETENESSHANLRGADWFKGDEGADFVEVSHHDCSRILDFAARKEDWSRHANVNDDANGYGTSRADEHLRTSNNSSNTRHELWTSCMGAESSLFG
jgi:hypothetical protein